MSTTIQEDSYTELGLPKEYRTGDEVQESEPVWVHDTSHFEMIENLGALRYVVGATYPVKGIPIPEAIYAVNQIKTILRETVKYLPTLMFYKKEKLLVSFNTITNRILRSRVVTHSTVPHKYLCPTAFGVYSIVSNFLVNIGIDEEIAENTGYNIAHIFEHDDAWRYRLQDMATETNIDKLFDNPTQEIDRLLHLYKNRQDVDPTGSLKGNDTPHVARIRVFTKLIKYILYIPKYKHAFRSIIRFIKMMEYDDADWYWVCLRDDYNYGGKNVEERTKGIVIPKRYLMKDGKLLS